MTEQSIETLIRRLREGDDDVQQDAARALVAYGEQAVESLLNILRAYSSWEDYEREDAAYLFNVAEDVLIAIGAPSVPLLIDALRGESWGARAGAIFVLGEMRDVRAVQPLIDLLQDDDVNTFTDVAEALMKIGSIAVRPLMYALGSPMLTTRRHAASILGYFKDPLATPALITALDDDGVDVRAAAAHALGEIADARAVEPLMTAAQDTEPAVREAAIRALGSIGQKLNTPSLTRALVKALHDGDWGTRQSAAEMLILMNSDYAQTARELLTFDLRQEDAEVRLGAAWSLIPVKDAAAYDTLAELLTREDSPVRSQAALGLGEFGERRAIPLLLDALSAVNAADANNDMLKPALQTALRRLGHDPGE